MTITRPTACLLVKLLESLGQRVDEAEEGRQAVGMVCASPYHLVFMDVQMPLMDGFEATREIRKREGTVRHMPIIAMTAHAMKGDRERCLQAGMDDYMTKPFEVESFIRFIEKYAGGDSLPRPE